MKKNDQNQMEKCKEWMLYQRCKKKDTTIHILIQTYIQNTCRIFNGENSDCAIWMLICE